MGLAFGAWAADEAVKLEQQADKNSYAVGFQMGESLKKQGIEVNAEALIAGIREGLAGNPPRLSRQEMQAARVDLQNQVRAARQKQLQEQASANIAAGQAFLTENAKKEGVKTLPSGLQYKVIEEGGGRSPSKTDTVKVQYRGTLIDGTEFDSSYKRNAPATFPVNAVIPGWAEALQLMKEGAKWQLVIPPSLAYGERGAPPRVPPNSVLVFDVELLSIEQPAKPPGEADAPKTP
jgi:FKBP-type peptidyl-prolyl cis-trans isomerase FklB